MEEDTDYMLKHTFHSEGLHFGNSLYSKKIAIHSLAMNESGVYSLGYINAGEIVGINMGTVISDVEYQSLHPDLKRHPLQISDHHYLVLHDKARFDVVEYFNHSCNPNIGILGNNVFIAIKDIKEGEELRYDYAMSDTTDSDMRWICECESNLCRKRITPEDWRLPELQERYGIFFSRYILEKIRESME